MLNKFHLWQPRLWLSVEERWFSGGRGILRVRSLSGRIFLVQKASSVCYYELRKINYKIPSFHIIFILKIHGSEWYIICWKRLLMNTVSRRVVCAVLGVRSAVLLQFVVQTRFQYFPNVCKILITDGWCSWVHDVTLIPPVAGHVTTVVHYDIVSRGCVI